MDDIKNYSLLPLRDMVLFPHMTVPLFIGRDKSIKALDEAILTEQPIILVAQKDGHIDEPFFDDLYTVGTKATITQILRLPDGTIKALVKGIERVRITSLISENPFFQVEASSVLDEQQEDNSNLEALSRTVFEQFETYVKLNRKISPDILLSVSSIQDISQLSDVIASHLILKNKEKQKILEEFNLKNRLEMLFDLMETEINILNIEKKIRNRVKKQMEKTQKDFYLNEQMKAIQKEMGEEDIDDTSELKKKINSVGLSNQAKEKALSELRKLNQMGPLSAESGIIRNYLDWILSLPWRKEKIKDIDLIEAKKILDSEHYGLEKVKDRIIEYLAVVKKTNHVKGPILCLVGPPGTGKTSLAKSIAKAMKRSFVRASLGGLHDEAEIRGHRRTYIGSMPGKIISGLKKVKTLNTLFLLDEIDKVSSDYRGDPASALLEVLDPEQNNTFNDNYLEIDYDLSPVMFMTTANTLKMSKPLLDRMEIIHLSGYTEEEKLQIARRHLLPKQMEQTGLKEDEFVISDEALVNLIRYYTKESGVRELEKQITSLLRKSVKEMLMFQKSRIEITAENLSVYAGVRKFSFAKPTTRDYIGVATGLAWTEVGGETLSIETALMPGKGNIIQTGQLGDVMKESIEAARSYIRSHASELGIEQDVFEKNDIHIHVPEGATPKDGPSAGITMCSALVSTLTNIPICKDVAMTGEITLRGHVLPIGGLKEKLLAALRDHKTIVIIPKENEKDLEDIPDYVKDKLKIIPVENITEVLNIALTTPPKGIKNE